jgi:hypothetical protein
MDCVIHSGTCNRGVRQLGQERGVRMQPSGQNSIKASAAVTSNRQGERRSGCSLAADGSVERRPRRRGRTKSQPSAATRTDQKTAVRSAADGSEERRPWRCGQIRRRRCPRRCRRTKREASAVVHGPAWRETAAAHVADCSTKDVSGKLQ